MINTLSLTQVLQSAAAEFPSALSILLLLLKVTGFLLIALLATFALQRKSAGTRHLVWLIALAALLIVPVLAVWSPLPVAVLPTAYAPAQASPVSALDPGPERAGNRVPTPVAGEQQLDAGPTRPIAPAAAAPSLATILLTIWAVIAGALLLRLLYGAWSVRRIVRRGQLLEHPAWQTPLYEIADRLELNAAPTLLRSEDVKMPFAAGVLHSTIVLPAESDGWSAERRTAVLIHELGHIRRRDLIGHTLGRIACALYWFHPLVWTAARQLRAESERACDDLALVFGAKPSDYAEHLLDIVTCVRDHYTPAVALAMAHRKEFEGRMLAILNPELTRRGLGRLETASLVGGLVVMAAVIGSVSPVARAATTHERVELAQPTATDTARREQLPVAPLPNSLEAHRQPVARPVPAAQPGPNAAPKPAPAAGLSGDTPNRPNTQSDDERADALAKTLRTDADAEVRRLAAWGLARYARIDVGAEALVNAVNNDTDAEVREMAVWALAGARRNPAASAAVTKALKDKEPRVRETAVWAAGSMGDEAALPGLIAALGDADPDIRGSAAWSIGSIGPDRAPAPLVNLLKDSDKDVRETVAWALYTIRDASTADALMTAFEQEQEPEVRQGELRALATMGERAMPVLQKLLTSPDPKVRQMAVQGLAGGDASGPWPQPRPRPRPYP
jgi:beta-lactamase regulating signal transducer with metallopeptidase domain